MTDHEQLARFIVAVQSIATEIGRCATAMERQAAAAEREVALAEHRRAREIEREGLNRALAGEPATGLGLARTVKRAG